MFDCASRLRQFRFEIPFVKGENKVQGSVESQWLRRVILSTDTDAPGIAKRQLVPVTGYKTIDFEPIRVACQQLKGRVTVYQVVIDSKEMSALQPLLQGSLMTAVNEGSHKFAEVFLNTEEKTKYTEKLRKLYKQFLEFNQQGMEIMREWVKVNQGFAGLFEALCQGLTTLEQKLAPYLKLEMGY